MFVDDQWCAVAAEHLLTHTYEDMFRLGHYDCRQVMGCQGIEFGSTEPDSVKWKIKHMTLLIKTREQPSLMLCGIMQPWVEKTKHLGNTITNFKSQNRNQLDTNTRTTRYIDKRNSITQEF